MRVHRERVTENSLTDNLLCVNILTLRPKKRLVTASQANPFIYSGSTVNEYLFGICFRQALDKVDEGILLNGDKMKNVRYADDTVTFANYNRVRRPDNNIV